jgi:DNA end-binding protein Ku
LLRDALKAADRMAVVTVSLRARMTIAVLRVRDDVIVLQTMLWPDEIRAPEFASLDEVPEVKDSELAMANMLVESLAGDYQAEDYEDDFKEAVEALVKAKLEGGEVKQLPEAKDSGGEVVDLLAALQRSVERAKSSRGEPASETAVKKKAVKETAKKTTAKESANGKSSGNGKSSDTETESKESAAKPAKKAPARKRVAS